jgi:hypothetical protein
MSLHTQILTSPKFSNKLQLQKAGTYELRGSWKNLTTPQLQRRIKINSFQNFPEIPKFSSDSAAGKLHKNYII